jgi:hypothetical protein
MTFRPLDRAATAVLMAISRRSWGMGAVIMPYIVEALGPFSALQWLAKNMPKYERALADMGMVRGNLAFSIASMLNGCAYCTYAHGRAFELHYFEEYGRLFPLDEHALLSLLERGDDELGRELDAALKTAGLEEAVPMFHRIYALKLEGAEPRAEDEHLLQAISMYDVLNFCAIRSQAALDDAHDRVNKDTELKARYAEARLREKTQNDGRT